MDKRKLRRPTGIIFVNDGYELWHGLEDLAIKSTIVSIAVGLIARYGKGKCSHGLMDADSSNHGADIIYREVLKHIVD